MKRVQSIRQKYLIFIIGIVLFILGSLCSFAIQPSYDLAQQLEKVRIECSEENNTFEARYWRGYFWSERKLHSGLSLSRGHYPFKHQRRTVLRLTHIDETQCNINIPEMNLPSQLILGNGYPGPSRGFDRSGPHTITIFVGKQKIHAQKFKRVQLGWKEFPINLAAFSGQRQSLKIQVEFTNKLRRKQGVFFNITSKTRIAALGSIMTDSPLIGRLLWWTINWMLCLGLIFLLWALLEYLNFFENYRYSFTRRTTCILFFLALLGIACASWNLSLQPSHALHFVQQADGFIRGTTAVATHNDLGGDRGWFEGLQYAPNPPLVGLLMIPIVALIGFKLNDVIFVLVCAAFNFVLLSTILERLAKKSVLTLTSLENIGLSFLFCFATPLFCVSILGQVWMAALVISVTMILIALGFCIVPVRPLLAGLALGAGLLARPPVAGHGLLCVAFIGYWVWKEGWSLKRFIWQSFLVTLGPMSGIGLTFAYNWIRFHSIFDSGYHLLGYREMQEHGLFNTRFFSYHINRFLLKMPHFDRNFPYIRFSLGGNSILATFPSIIATILPQRVPFLWWAALITTLICIVPAMFYAGTGWKQFGFRRLTDALPALILWLALGRKQLGWWFWLLLFIGFVINIAGAYWVHGPDWNDPQIYYDTY